MNANGTVRRRAFVYILAALFRCLCGGIEHFEALKDVKWLFVKV